MTSAVVFAYHNVGVRCLKVLLAQSIEVKLIITHEDHPHEIIWFDSVKQLALDYDIPVITPATPNTSEIEAQIRYLAPDFLFSFYYRHLLKVPLLNIPKQGAFNMHGSLLPKYRGRVPVNWAIIQGETETGATLHRMETTPDTGAIVDSQAVPILPDDTAQDVFNKVVVAAEICLIRALPRLIEGHAEFHQQDLSQGHYWRGRSPEEGQIDWSKPVESIHNFIRALTYPYPGAFTDTPRGRLTIWRTRLLDKIPHQATPPHSIIDNKKLIIHTADHQRLQILESSINGQAVDAQTTAQYLEHLFPLII